MSADGRLQVVRKKILLIRLDKIGDLICTLPVDQVIDHLKYEVFWIVQKGMGQVVDLGVQKRNYFELDKNDSKTSAQKLSEILNEVKPEIAISFQAPWWVNFELFKARVKVRAGVKSQWHSFLFLNQGLRQKRSLSLMHEFDYNLELVLKTLNQKKPNELIYFQIQKPTQKITLKKFKLEEKNYVVVHPGMMGSALNWKQSQYISYIHQQLQLNKKIVITGTDSDESYLDEIKKEFLHEPNMVNLQSKLNLNELIQILSFSEWVVAPSTGVAHLAASVGAKVFAIYSPIRVHHPRRWAARGRDVKIMLPLAQCPASHRCLKKNCSQYNCMDLVTL